MDCKTQRSQLAALNVASLQLWYFNFISLVKSQRLELLTEPASSRLGHEIATVQICQSAMGLKNATFGDGGTVGCVFVDHSMV